MEMLLVLLMSLASAGAFPVPSVTARPPMETLGLARVTSALPACVTQDGDKKDDDGKGESKEKKGKKKRKTDKKEKDDDDKDEKKGKDKDGDKEDGRKKD